ncbi:MAG TPA: FAD/NAD(P)-binding protein [Sphingobium sp.]|uniref:FAD/NAD(P)-binding protein n=1 Tax=Sphingobium sp. TaxID=1912891 RepID=UPI002ED24E33
MIPTIAFVGAGPTTIYTLNALIDRASRPFSLTIFEAQASIGRGTPYRPGWNDPAMLSNIASVEIPPLAESLVDWLERQPSERLARIGIAPTEIDDRTFYPRLALGEFFFDQLQVIIGLAEAKGIEVDVRTGCRVVDAINEEDGMRLSVQPKRGVPFEQSFDHVVLATGHQWPAEPEVRPGYFLSPWPASSLAEVPPVPVCIRGSSLSAIDAAVALAVTHGEFVEDDRADLVYQPSPDTGEFRITMISRKGLLPEADFYFPIPYEPLAICTREAVQRLVEETDGDLLDKAFDLFRRELSAADPDYADRIGLDGLDLEGFAERYFAERIATGTFEWAETNLREAQANYQARFTIPWRYAILRMHEVLETLVPHLDDDEFERFSRFFSPVFVDDYATVPHESIMRMLALHRAGKLDVIAVGKDYRVDSHAPETGADLIRDGHRTHFPVFIEAMGQRALSAGDFPFPSLRRQGIIRDANPSSGEGPVRGIAIDDEFHPISDDIPEDRLFCLSLPFLMGRHPFVQGITSAHEMGGVVGEKLASAVDGADDDAPEGSRRTAA